MEQPGKKDDSNGQSAGQLLPPVVLSVASPSLSSLRSATPSRYKYYNHPDYSGDVEAPLDEHFKNGGQT
jgi:hypothetical protein